jgi:hypothetical protein
MALSARKVAPTAEAERSLLTGGCACSRGPAGAAVNDSVSDDYIDIGTLRKTGVVSDETAMVLVETIAARHGTEGFSLHGFLEAMCEAHGYRPPPEETAAAA